MIRLFKKKKLPFIVMGDNKSEPVVNCDDYNGGYVMGDYLIRHGHRDILFLTSDRPVPSVYRRTEGFRQALRDHDLPVREEYFLSVEDSGVPLLPQHADQRRLPPEAEPFWRGKFPLPPFAATIPCRSCRCSTSCIAGASACRRIFRSWPMEVSRISPRRACR